MTDADHAAAAWVELGKTTDSYPSWVRKGRPSTSHWAAAKQHLDAIQPAVPAAALTGAHWPAVADLPTLKTVGYGYATMTLDTNYEPSWAPTLDAADAAGLKLIVGGYPEPYTLTNGEWAVTAQGQKLLAFLASRASSVVALFVYNEPYWISPFTRQSNTSGAVPATDLRGLRLKIREVWPAAKVYHDIGAPSLWAPGGDYANSYPGIGNKYADQTGVADYVGVWDYPFATSGYQRARGLATLARETAFVRDKMGAVPVWLGQACSSPGDQLVYPSAANIKDWNLAVRAALPAGSLVSWYVWRQAIYPDVLANHPEQWPSTTAGACP